MSQEKLSGSAILSSEKIMLTNLQYNNKLLVILHLKKREKYILNKKLQQYWKL